MNSTPKTMTGALCLAACLFSAQAALQCYEPYNYTLGATPTVATGIPTQTTGGGFTGPYNGGAGTKLTVAGLTYPGLLTANNALNITGGYIGENVASPISSGTVYVSFLMNKSSNPSAVLMGLEMNTGGNGMFVGVTAASSGSEGYLGVNRQAGYNNGAEVIWVSPTANITYGNTYFVVVKLVRNGANWDGSIWLNPTAGTSTEPAADGTFTIAGFTISACTVVNPGGGDFNFDELRIGTTWNDAVSAPSPLTVSITSPVAAAVVSPTFTISANAEVSPGTVTNVDFYVDAAWVGSDPTAPFSYAVSGATLGVRALKAIAQDSNGNSATSSVVNVTVSNLPPVSAYEPFNYTTLATGDPTTASGFTGNWEVASGHSIVPGLTYSTLPVANNALSQGAGQCREALANSVSSGTVFVSFLYRQATTVNSGNNGGNWSGLGLVDGTGTGIIIGNIETATATQGRLGVRAVSAYTTFGAIRYAPLASAPNHTYGTTNFIVVQLTGTGSGWTTGNFWLNPPVGTNSPGTPNGTFTASQFSIAAIETVNGLGGNAVTFDEIRLGSTYGEVVGSSAGATVPTTLALSVESGTQVSWTAVSGNYYQPQSSPDNSSWTDLGPLLSGAVANSAYDPATGLFYQVLEVEPAITEEALNGGFETDLGDPALLASWAAVGTMPPTRIDTDFHTGTACASLYVTNADITAQTSVLEQNLLNQGGNFIVEGNTYHFSFWAKSLGKNPSGGYVQQYKIAWLNESSAIVGEVGWTDFTGGAGVWSQVSPGPVVAPAGAINALIQIFGATGGIAGDYGGVLIDDVSLTTTSPTGPATVIPSTTQSGAVFMATVQTNGITATAATGTVAFKTNNVAQSTGTVANGEANSTPTAVPASYTITAIYSGDGTYRSSTNTLVIGSGVNPTPPLLSSSISGNQLTLSWPSDRTGWSLQTQTNSRSVGLNGTWFPVVGSTTTNQMTFTINPANPTVFFRMQYTP